MMFAAEKLFGVSEHPQDLDPCQVLDRDIAHGSESKSLFL